MNPDLKPGALAKDAEGTGRLNRAKRRSASRKSVEAAIAAANRRSNDALSAIREFVYNRDKGKCRAFGTPLIFGVAANVGGCEIHHIVFRSQGGSDEPDNLICLSETAHDMIHDGELAIEGDPNGDVKFTQYEYAGGSRKFLREWVSTI